MNIKYQTNGEIDYNETRLSVIEELTALYERADREIRKFRMEEKEKLDVRALQRLDIYNSPLSIDRIKKVYDFDIETMKRKKDLDIKYLHLKKYLLRKYNEVDGINIYEELGKRPDDILPTENEDGFYPTQILYFDPSIYKSDDKYYARGYYKIISVSPCYINVIKIKDIRDINEYEEMELIKLSVKNRNLENSLLKSVASTMHISCPFSTRDGSFHRYSYTGDRGL